MAGAVYSRASGDDGSTQVRLLAAKTKLTPIRGLQPATQTTQRMTIPRLELRAALLGAKQLNLQAKTLNIELGDCFAWSDSQIVVHRLASDQPIGKDLVDNYISHIQELLPNVKWRYVPTDVNPADLATRGASIEKLAENKLWWQGPSWLQYPSTQWPRELSRNNSDTPSLKEQSQFQCLTIQAETTIIDQFSSLTRLLKNLVRCRRLFRYRLASADSIPPLGPITAEEFNKEFLTCVKLAQKKDFASEKKLLARTQHVQAASNLARLNPFLDEHEVLRVGGRLGNSSLSDEEKHPPILASHCHLANLIIGWDHERALHAGPTVTYAYTLKRAWIIRGLNKVKSLVGRCVVCARASRKTSSQLMAHLPAERVIPSRPFSKVGVDYAGPFQILRSKRRGISTSKGYVDVFVCLATKPIHLELVGDLTTESFLASLSRFVGRRGRPLELWSDNATNFRGADQELRQMFLEATINWNHVKDHLTQEQITWKFIPPSAPHFGGLWEAGVKSMKNHFRKVAGARKLTYEEFSTLLVEVEMVLNGRPIVPLTNELDDLDVLTPRTFLDWYSTCVNTTILLSG